jgi:hypothetical protein
MAIKRTTTQPATKGTYVDLPEDLYLWIKHHAVDQGMSLRAVIQKALEDYRKRKGGK